MEAVKFHILCSLNEESCQRVQALVKEPFKITKIAKFNRYEVLGQFKNRVEAQLWAGDLYKRAGTDIARLDLEPISAN